MDELTEPITEANTATFPLTEAARNALFEADCMPLLHPLYNFAYHLAQDETDAEDLLQDTLERAYRYLDKFEQGTNIKAWLFRIMKNLFINDYRKRSRMGHHTVNFDELRPLVDADRDDESSASDDANGSYTDPRHDPLFDFMQFGDEVSAALDALPADARTIIVLSDLEDFSYEEMSKILNVPVGTVRSRLFRARNLLKQKLVSFATAQGFVDKRN